MKSRVEIELEKEIRDAQAALAATPEARNLARLTETLSTYRGRQDATARLTGVAAVATVGEIKTSGRSRSPERQAILDATKEWLQTRPIGIGGVVPPYRTKWIYEHLTEAGISVPGANPINNLSAMLSNAPEFVAHGKRGWTLAKNENPDDAETLTREASAGDIESRIDLPAEPRAQGGEARPGGGT